MSTFGVETIGLDLPPLAVEFAARLKRAGVPVGVERSTGFAHALTLVRPISRTRLYWTARSTFVTERSQVPAFNAVFAEVFGFGQTGEDESVPPPSAATTQAPDDEREATDRTAASSTADPSQQTSSSTAGDQRRETAPDREIEVPMLATDEELLRARRFDSLSARELAELYRMMSRLTVEMPTRRSRRRRRDRHGSRIDVRSTMRRSMRSGGDPIRLVRRHRRVVPRRIVMICDISGSMEPYARAYLQFLTSVAGCGVRSGGPVEAFVFATRLTRVTRALATRSPDRAIQRAANAADWSGGTRIGEALKRFNDRYGRRGMARGSVIVILSDGWERGDPALVSREMERLSRLASRIIWVNPRVAARDFVPKAAGMVAALPFVDALVGGESLAALDEVAHAISCAPDALPGSDWVGLGAGRSAADTAEAEPQDEPWGSATPVQGSSVAMPSGWGPSRGRTTPGWSQE